MEHLRQLILACLKSYPNDDDKVIDKFNEIAAVGGKQAYQVMLHVLTELNISQAKAPKCWREIMSHREKLKKALGRSVSLKTAICDYFSTVNKHLKHPKTIDVFVTDKHDYASKVDRLTGLHNRNILDDFLEREVARSKRYDCELSLLLFEIDDLQRIIDEHGHVAEDLVLKNVAGIILKGKRTEDIAVLYGKGKILAIMPETGKLNSIVLGERVRESVEKLSIPYEGEKLSVTISAGLVAFPLDDKSKNGLLACVEKALLQAKEMGENRVHLFSELKRRYIRLNFSTQIVVNKLGVSNNHESIRAKSKDLSLGGLLFETSSPIEIGTKVEINVVLDRASDVMEVFGTVVRVEEFGPDQYEVGISFLEMDGSVKNEINEYISQHLID